MAPVRTIGPEDLLEHLEWMRRLARALVREPAAAEDLAQQTAEVALLNPPAADRPLRPWLAGVMRNLARMTARGGARRARREQAAGDDAASAPTPEQLVERVQTQRQLAELVLALPEELRTALLLRYYEGLSAAAIARTLDLPAGTVRWRLKRALDHLRERLDEAHDGDRRRWAVLLLPLPAPLGEAGASAGASAGAASIAKGIIAMKAATKVILAVAALLLVALGGRHLLSERGSDAAPPVLAADEASAAHAVPAGVALRTVHQPSGGSAAMLVDAEPEGWLRLEGQVIDANEAPVPGAFVAIDSNPPRQTRAEADGSFSFDGLVPRAYELQAIAGELFAGPVATRLGADSEPVVLRARPGIRVIVAARDADAGTPIAGAAVELRSTFVWQATTDAEGQAVLTGVGPGWRPLHVAAPGFAPAAQMVDTYGVTEVRRVDVRLSRGAPLTGRVIDAQGSPIAGARVWAASTSEPFPVVDPRLDAVLTDARGRWELPAVAAGSYRISADHPEHAPGTTPPIAVDGLHRRDRIDIALEPGGQLVGTVTAADGTPLAAAEIRLAVAGSGLDWRTMRHALSDARGRFALRGLPRRRFDVVAVHERGSSELQTIDIAGQGDGPVALVVTVEGAIAGVAVTPAGEPVAEAQLVIEPVWRGARGEREEWQVRQLPKLVSDSAGRFRFTGLPQGRYRVRGALPGARPDSMWLATGVEAEVGAADVRLVLSADGSIAGRVQLADGSAPAMFRVSAGRAALTPVIGDDGHFEVELPAGVHHLDIAGTGFVSRQVHDVEVAPQERTDLGTITVEAGRSISGRVLGPDGAPIAGAAVAAGELVTGTGARLNLPEEGFGVRETTSDADGRFTMSGFGSSGLAVVAQADGVGRSASVAIPNSRESAMVDLVLHPTGRLSGRATQQGKPLADIVVIANPLGATRSNFFVTTGADGAYAFEMLSGGAYVVSAMLGQGGNRPKDIHFVPARVEPGAEARADIEVPVGTIDVDVTVRLPDGAAPAFTPVIAATGRFEAPTMAAMREVYHLDRGASIYLRQAMGGQARLEGLTPQLHTVCAIGMPADPNAAMKLRSELETLPLACVPLDLSGKTGALTLEVPVQPPPEPPTAAQD